MSAKKTNGINRRAFLRQTGGGVCWMAAAGLDRGLAATPSEKPDHTGGEESEAHSIVLATRELRVVVGNNQAGGPQHPLHRQRYNGVWSLTSVHTPDNCFVPFYAGLNLEHFMDDLFMTPQGGDIFEPRNLSVRLDQLSATAVKLSHAPSPLTGVESETVFALREPHAIDFAFRARLHRAPRAGRWMGFFWASYLNAPDSPALYFKDPSNRWACLSADAHGHGAGNTVCHESVSTPAIGDPSRTYAEHSLAHSCSQRRFRIPLMFGRPGDGRMALLYMFDQSEPVRLTMSPSGGGVNQEKQTYNPAWDFQYIVPTAKPGQEVRLRARVIYKPYEGREEIEHLYEQWRHELAAGNRPANPITPC